MYCGSCLRDNTLAAELLAQGHDVLLVPLYTPTLTEERNVSCPRVFFGGISIYLQQHLSLFRKTPSSLDRLWDHPLVLKLASGRGIQTNPQWLGAMTVSMLKGEDGFQRKEIHKLLGWLLEQPPPDVINLPNSLLMGLAKPLKGALKRPLCCTLQGEDLFLRNLSQPYQSRSLDLIRSGVEHVDAFVAVSHFCADFMADYLGIPGHKMRVVPLGINLDGYVWPQNRRPDVFTIGYLARITPEKGLHLLCQAYRLLRQSGRISGTRLEAAGYLAPEHQLYLKGLESKMREWGLADEFRYRGSLDRSAKIQFLSDLTVLSVPATYDEPKGLFVLEALASGVPVVEPRRGAFPEMIERTSGGLLVDPDSAESLAEGILALYRNPSLVRELARKGREAVEREYTAEVMANRTLAVYAELAKTATT